LRLPQFEGHYKKYTIEAKGVSNEKKCLVYKRGSRGQVFNLIMWIKATLLTKKDRISRIEYYPTIVRGRKWR